MQWSFNCVPIVEGIVTIQSVEHWLDSVWAEQDNQSLGAMKFQSCPNSWGDCNYTVCRTLTGLCLSRPGQSKPLSAIKFELSANSWSVASPWWGSLRVSSGNKSAALICYVTSTHTSCRGFWGPPTTIQLCTIHASFNACTYSGIIWLTVGCLVCPVMAEKWRFKHLCIQSWLCVHNPLLWHAVWCMSLHSVCSLISFPQFRL